MNSASATDPKRMVRVLLASLGIAVVLAWTELMFEFPSSTLPVSPNLTWFVVGGVICALAAMTVTRYVWAGVVAIPAIAVFAAWSATFVVAQVKPVNWWLPAPPLGYSGMALIVVAVVLPIAFIMATTGFQFGLPKSVSVAVAIIVFLAPFAGFVGFNVSDYAAFRSAMRRANGLDQRQLTAIATRCATFNEHRRYVRDWPPELAPLSPASVHVSRGLTYIPLYSRGQIYVEFRVETHDSGCRIYYFTNVDGPQKTVPLFSFDKQRRTAAAPEPRIVTLSERAMRPALAWIVLRNRMLVVGWSQRDDAYVVLAQAPLSDANREEIEHAVTTVKRLVRGRAFEAPVSDGLGLEIRFAADGAPADDDILLHNTWVEQTAPLIRAVARLSPSGFPLDYEEYNKEMHSDMPRHVLRVRSIADARSEHPQLPWWCVWRKFVGPQVRDLSAVNYTMNIADPLRYVDR